MTPPFAKSSDTPTVSVVMAVYNGADRLSATVDSVLGQVGVDIEFVIVDDGSSDGTSELLASLAAHDKRIRTIHQENAGLTAALAVGCAAARGLFIARQDCGDISIQGRLEQQSRCLVNEKEVAFVSCGTRLATVDGEWLCDLTADERSLAPVTIIDLDRPHGVICGPTHHGSTMFRRNSYERVGGYRRDFYYGQDWDLWYRLAQHGHFMSIAQTLYEARIAPSDISLRNVARQKAIGECSLDALKSRIAGTPEQPALDKAKEIRPGGAGMIANDPKGAGEYFIGERFRRQRKHDLAVRYFRDAIRENRWHYRARVRLLQCLASKYL